MSVGLGVNTIQAQCVASGDVNSEVCQRIVRDQVTGQIFSINTTINNEGRLKTSGIDVGINYSVPFSDIGLGIGGRLRVQELLSWLDKFDFNGTDFAGTSGGGIGGTIPEWKSTLTVAYDSDDFTAQMRWNWQSDLDDVAFSAASQIGEDKTAAEHPGPELLRPVAAQVDRQQLRVDGYRPEPVQPEAQEDGLRLHREGGVDYTYWSPVILGRYFTIQGKVKI